MNVAELVEQAKTLSAQDRKELVKRLVDLLDASQPESSPKQRSIVELRGLGKEIWEGIDAQDYVNQLRDEWDNPL